MEETLTDIKSELIDEIVCKVKSEGLFDQFRRECLADVDTKPAYQNLQHRVESSVSSYLGEQTWTPQLNKNQLREKLRKLITEKGFFEAGIERIVDQVVNPKLSSNLVPKIEDVAYKFLGVEKPSFNIKLELEVADDETSLPNLDLEQVSPESSEKSPSIESKSPALIANTMDAYHMHDESDDRMDDLESPAFEPIHASPTFEFKQEIVEKQDDDMDISDGDDDGPLQMNGSMMIANDEVKSNLSSISGLTSNDSNNDITNGINESDIKCEDVETSTNYDQLEQTEMIVEKEDIHIENCVAPEITIDSAEKLPQSENIISNTNELIVENMNQDSVLSQVSSTSRLSIVTNNNTNTRMDDGDGDGDGYSNHMSNEHQHAHLVRETCPYGISEEAQMQKFNESSSSSNSLVIDTDNISNGTNQCDKKEELITSFDIKREDIKFEGTERKSFDLSLTDSNEDKFNRCESNNDSTNNIYSMGTNMIGDHKVKTENLILYKQLSENSKLDEIDSTNSDNMTISIKSEFNSKSTSIDEKPSTPDTDDSKDKTSDSKSSLNRNGNDSDSSKHRTKDRSHHSSSRHRSHSEREKDRKSSSSSASKDKTKCLKEGSDSRDGSSKHRTSSSSSKHRHHKNESSRSSTSSSTKKDKDPNRDRSDKSKFDKNSPPPPDSDSHAKKSNEPSSVTTNPNKKEHSRHSSSSSSNSKHRSSSRKDDHSIYKEKISSRQRSRSKDSNDGSTHLQFGSQNVFSSTENPNANQSSSNNNNQSSGTCSNETQAITSHSINQTVEAVTEKISSRATANASPDSNDQQITSTQEDEEFVLTTKPVVVDQILAGNELNLEEFIGENRNDPVVSSIEQTLEQEVKKPKVAANIFEAKRLSKVRKEIERNKQKKLEQATVLVKKYIRTNPSTVRDDSQGVELEFACMKSDSGTSSVGPVISSPAKYKNGIIEPKTITPNATITSSSLNINSKLDESTSIETIAMESEDIVQNSDDRKVNENNNETDMTDMQNDDMCIGFDERALEMARESSCIFSESLKSIIEKAPLRNRSKVITKNINNTIFAPSTEEERHLLLETLNNQLLFLENNKLNEPTSKSKRFSNDIPNASNKISTSTNDDEMILASVFISQTSTECNVKPDSFTRSDAEPMNALSALEKQRQKTRYSNDDLFKPRPVLGGISRRRRGIM